MSRDRRPIHLATALLGGAALAATALAGPAASAPPSALTALGTYHSGDFDESAAEIVAYDPESQRLFVVNANEGVLDVIDISDPVNPAKIGEIVAGGEVNSVAVQDGLVAVAVQADPVQDPGSVELYPADGTAEVPIGARIGEPLTVGALPDMLTFTPDGTKIVVANEGEPDGYCEGGVDPEGSISIIDISGGAANVEQGDVATADFNTFDGRVKQLRRAGVRIFGPDATVSQDLEPEYVAISADSKTAWVSLQENNAFAVVNLSGAQVTRLLPLGYKDHSLEENAFDASNEDGPEDAEGEPTGAINIKTWPVSGMYMPDAIDAYESGGSTYLVTANEGDARDYDCFSEEARVKDLGDAEEGLEDFALDPDVFLNPDELQEDENLGRLNTTTAFPTSSPVTELFAYGARSFSIRDANGHLVFDSGDDFERITAEALPDDFNSTNDDNDSFDARSDDKGPEPEGIEIGVVDGTTYAFIGLERVGGIMVYDITDPVSPVFVDYVNNRDFDEDASLDDPESDDEDDRISNPAAGDLGPEGLTFISAEDSPTGAPLLAVGNEVSGTTTVYEFQPPSGD